MDRKVRRIKRYLRLSPVGKRSSVDVRQIIPLKRESVKENTAQKENLETVSKNCRLHGEEIQAIYKKRGTSCVQKRKNKKLSCHGKEI